VAELFSRARPKINRRDDNAGDPKTPGLSPPHACRAARYQSADLKSKRAEADVCQSVEARPRTSAGHLDFFLDESGASARHESLADGPRLNDSTYLPPIGCLPARRKRERRESRSGFASTCGGCSLTRDVATSHVAPRFVFYRAFRCKTTLSSSPRLPLSLSLSLLLCITRALMFIVELNSSSARHQWCVCSSLNGLRTHSGED